PTDMSAAAVERDAFLCTDAGGEQRKAECENSFYHGVRFFRTGEGAHSAPAGERSARGSLFLRSRAGIVVRVVNVFPVIYAEEVGPVEIGAADAVEIVPEVGRVAVGREYQLALAR